MSVPRETRDAVHDLLTEVPPNEHDARERFLSQPALQEYQQKYQEYFKQAMRGQLGPTAQYWTTYIYLINRIHRDLMRAVRTNNIEDYTRVLPEIIDVFFGLNRPNYAPGGVLFLHNLKKAAPEAKRLFEAGAFSVRRTKKQFIRSAVDLTLEQTVNKDAASPMRGIVWVHQSNNAIRRWCTTSTQRGMTISELRAMTGLETSEQPSAHLCDNRIEKDTKHRDDLYQAETDTCDPFAAPATLSPFLLNLATGKTAMKETETYLNETLVDGHKRHMKFREECTTDEYRFLKPIKRRPVAIFAKENAQKINPNAKGKTNESLRDVFIRILIAVSEKTNFSLKQVLAYPNTDYPLSLTHSDDFRIKTDKAKLLKKLEEFQVGFTGKQIPPIDVTLIDGGLLIYFLLR